MLQKALGCLFVFGIAPVGIGGLWTKGIGQKREKILNLYLAGFLSELAVFQLIAAPAPPAADSRPHSAQSASASLVPAEVSR